jgi:hypothetical protein
LPMGGMYWTVAQRWGVTLSMGGMYWTVARIVKKREPVADRGGCQWAGLSQQLCLGVCTEGGCQEAGLSQQLCLSVHRRKCVATVHENTVAECCETDDARIAAEKKDIWTTYLERLSCGSQASEHHDRDRAT